MKDIQNLHDSRRINIRKVGIRDLAYPIIVLDRACATQRTVARISMYVNLPHRFKGTHMSRFVEILHRFHGAFQIQTLHLMLEEMKTRLNAEAAFLSAAFPYFFSHVREEAGPGIRRYDCRLRGALAQGPDLVVEVDVPVPLHDRSCGDRSAASGLWGMVSTSVRMRRFLWIEDLIMLIEEAACAPAFPEKTVESVCRRVSEALQANEALNWHKVIVRNRVRGYQAFASMEWPRAASGPAVSRHGGPWPLHGEGRGFSF